MLGVSARVPIRLLEHLDQPLVEARAFGRVTPDDVLYALRMSARARLRRDDHLLWDFSAATSVQADGSDLARIADTARDYGGLLARGRCAVVSPSDRMFGVTRIVTARLGERVRTWRLFRELGTALQWLGMKPLAPTEPPAESTDATILAAPTRSPSLTGDRRTSTRQRLEIVHVRQVRRAVGDLMTDDEHTALAAYEAELLRPIRSAPALERAYGNLSPRLTRTIGPPGTIARR